MEGVHSGQSSRSKFIRPDLGKLLNEMNNPKIRVNTQSRRSTRLPECSLISLAFYHAIWRNYLSCQSLPEAREYVDLHEITIADSKAFVA
jgi:hypothetical protein